MTESASERRRFQRIATDKTVTLRAGGTDYRGTVVDVSLRGLLFEPEVEWLPTKRTDVHAKIRLDDEMCGIEMNGEIVHVSGGRIGVRCTSIDIDSASRLRRLVELNLADHRLLERELTELIAV